MDTRYAQGNRGEARRSAGMRIHPLGPSSVLVRVDLAFTGHDDGERPQGMLDRHSPSVMGEHVRQAPIRHRALVEIGAEQEDAAIPEPLVHLGPREAALRLLATERAAGA